tara:strand:- start:8976 stop:9347 length:372 start_codon:yes stop_codon:yes gene_type:complete
MNKTCIDCQHPFFDRKGNREVCNICFKQNRPYRNGNNMSDEEGELRVRARNLEKKPSVCLGANCTKMVNTDRCHRFCKNCQRTRNRNNEIGQPKGRINYKTYKKISDPYSYNDYSSLNNHGDD